ncbi:MAG TPA: hypothetical protein VD978_19630 [Azospirillum sp.]|nr:hypothetical protein [Azospirillum sp.]
MLRRLFARPPRRRVVIVLGMHNSGTSLLARAIALMGVELGRHVLTRESFERAPRYDYWEHAQITEIQDRLLQTLDRYWNQERADWAIPASAWQRPEVLAMKNELAEILRRELGETPAVWGFKDPRTVRLMPLWHDLATVLRLDPLYLISLRDPATVATSFASKGQVSYELAERLWTRHYFEALQYSQGAPRLVTDYDAWFADPNRQFERLADALGLDDPERRAKARAEVAATIDPGLKQHSAPPGAPLSPITRDLHALLLRMAEGRTDPAAEAALLARQAELALAG